MQELKNQVMSMNQDLGEVKQRCFHLEEENTGLKSQSSNLSRTLQAAELRAKELEDRATEDRLSFAEKLDEVNRTYVEFRQSVWGEQEGS